MCARNKGPLTRGTWLAAAWGVVAVSCASAALAQHHGPAQVQAGLAQGRAELAQDQVAPTQGRDGLTQGKGGPTWSHPHLAQGQPELRWARLARSAETPAELVKARQRELKKLGAAFKVIRDELRGGSPDATKIRAASADITGAATAIGSWFPTGTGPDSGIKTDAKPEVWTDGAGFAIARETFVREANRWTQLGNSGDTAAWNEAAASLGQTCKGCHDKYRVKRE